LGGIEGLPLRLLNRYLQERQDGGQGRTQRLVEPQHFAYHLLAPAPQVIAVVDAAIVFEQVQHWQVGGRLAIGHRAAGEHEPSLGVMGMQELVDEARLPHARLAHQRHHLAVPGLCLRQGLLQGV
jgi:hypothetical protein